MSESLEEFYYNLLEISSPWKVAAIQRDSTSKEVTVIVEYDKGQPYCCPECGSQARLHDHRKRRWRHLDSCNHKTIVEAEVPRVVCENHGVKQLPVSWAEKHSRFTLEFERVILLWLKEDSISTVAANFHLSWDQVDRIMSRAVDRGLKRRKKNTPEL